MKYVLRHVREKKNALFLVRIHIVHICKKKKVVYHLDHQQSEDSNSRLMMMVTTTW